MAGAERPPAASPQLLLHNRLAGSQLCHDGHEAAFCSLPMPQYAA